jgi:spoIIIJ-associated protein
MEWVETTGRTVEDALDAALDELGVDEEEVEYEVLEEPRGGLLGRKDARVRARVKPLSREKPGDRRRRSGTGDRGRSRGGRPSGGRGGGSGRGRGGGSRPEPGAPRDDDRGEPSGSPSGGAPRRRRRGGRERRPANGESTTKREDDVSETEVPVEDQARAAEEFTRGLVDAFGADASVQAKIDEENVLVDVTGGDLGLLVGPKGATLQAIEELVRTVVQRRTEGHGTRINVDVAGYRAKRREALEGFVRGLADKVRESGKDQALEPMSASDRKIVHDAIAPLDGVTTVSEGEDPRRRVVVRPG